MIVNLLAVARIRIDGGTQARERIDDAVVADYAEAMSRQIRFPPVIVYHDGTNHWLADGFHRYHAALKINAGSLEVEIRKGGVEMARLYAAMANAEHGLRRTQGDKRRAVELVLGTKEGRRWSQERIARHCGVDQSYVSRVKAGDDTHNAQKHAQPRQRGATKTEQKAAGIAEYIAANPRAGDSAVARKLGVHRKTVAKVRAAAGALPRDGRRRRRAASDRDRASVPPVGPGPYSSEEAKAAAEEVKAARARMTEQDWHLVVREIGGAL